MRPASPSGNGRVGGGPQGGDPGVLPGLLGGFQGGQLGQFGNLGGQFGFQGGTQEGILISTIRQLIGSPSDWAPIATRCSVTVRPPTTR